MFFRLHFKCHFWQDFLNFWSHFGVHLAPFFRKKLFRKWLRKKGPHTWKLLTIVVSRGSQRGRLACALLKQERTVRAQISKIAARAHVLCSKMLFQFVSIDFFQKCAKNYKESMSKTHYWLSSRGSQRGRLACALFKQETTVRAQISKIAARAHVLCSKMLF